MIVVKDKVRAIVKGRGLRISSDAFEGIDRVVTELIEAICDNVESDNVKTLGIHHALVQRLSQVRRITKGEWTEAKTLSKAERREVMEKPFKTTAEVMAEARKAREDK